MIFVTRSMASDLLSLIRGVKDIQEAYKIALLIGPLYNESPTIILLAASSGIAV